MKQKHSRQSRRLKFAAIGGVSLLSLGALAATVNSSAGVSLAVVPGAAPSLIGFSSPVPPTDTVTKKLPGETYATALAMWRAPRVKGSCASCHGPDFFDLARIGTSVADTIRRAQIDGASEAEANALVAGIGAVRARYALPPENPRTFRPFQPGGAVLPGATSIERDAALGDEMASFLPTLSGATPIRSLADAKRARDELLNIDFSRMKIGIQFPLWSADLAHGPNEGTINDWVTDIARVAKPGNESAWLALQDKYLNDPSDYNFWNLYFSVDKLTQSFTAPTPYDPADAAKVERFAAAKFKSTLLGHHGLRARAMGNTSFMRNGMALAYLASEDPFRTSFANQPVFSNPSGEKMPRFLPNPWWEIGEAARSAFRPSDASLGVIGNKGQDNARDVMRLLGYPSFVLDSVDPQLRADAMLDDLQLSWFMLGATLDPAQTRISQSNSTLVGEYLQAAMWRQDMFIHRTLQTGMRLVAASYRPDAAWGKPPAPYMLNFNYFAGYNRATPTRWNSPGNSAVSPTIKAKQLEAFKRITANFFRMSLYLHEEALDQGLIQPYGTTRTADYDRVNAFFDYAQLPGREEDDALIRRVAAKSQTPLTF